MSCFHVSGVSLVLLYIFLTMAACDPDGLSVTTESSNSSDYFLYFAYGSNLLKERLQKKNPSATVVSVGCLQNYALRFGWQQNRTQNNWHGGVATVERSDGAHVWGCVWRMSSEDLQTLDDQEAVQSGLYRPIQVNVTTDQGEILCRSYQMNDFNPCATSPPYKQVVCLGARQRGLPLDYIEKLEAVPTNGYAGPSILDTLQRIQADSSS